MSASRPLPRTLSDTAEGQRLANAARTGWRRWGPYVSDRQWGTVREDYSAGGDAWDYLPFDDAVARAYRWGEDAIAGFCDERQLWCMGLGLWNGNDPIIKERLFGLTNAEGNHGEDVKELYFYTDATPTHSYQRMLYKYPHAAFPYAKLRAENARRDQTQPEYELLDTGVLDGDRCFDVTIEYAKAAPDDVLMRVTARNRASVAAPLHLLPQFWARNVWSWTRDADKPALTLQGAAVVARHPRFAPLCLAADRDVTWLFCENESNPDVFNRSAVDLAGRYKDGINRRIVQGETTATRADGGTKAAAWVRLDVPAGGEVTLRLRFAPLAASSPGFADFDQLMALRLAEADEFYAALQAGIADADARLVQRQALAGLLWSKQFYCFDVRRWLQGDPAEPMPPEARWHGRNTDWQHLDNADVISMPDKWEYPWYASWDLGFQAVCFSLIDPDFAKSQILLLLRDDYMHPNGQLPAYEWSFGDANPPVQAWAALAVFQRDRARTGVADTSFLRRVLHKLLLNFGWWVNRKDALGHNIFQGGFLGLDNIEIFNRSAPLPTGGTLNQADGTAWMASYALGLMRISLELAKAEPVYEDLASKFFEHFLYIAGAMAAAGTPNTSAGLWDEQDGFFYDMLCLPDGSNVPLRIHSIIGLIPMLAVQVLEPDTTSRFPVFAARLDAFLTQRPDLAALISYWNVAGEGSRRLLSLLRGHRMKCLLSRMLDEAEFLSPHGIRALSKYHLKNPYVYDAAGQRFSVSYVPAESDSRLFGGNSNWRGPVWLPLNYALISALRNFHRYYGDDFRVEYPTGSGVQLSLMEIADRLAARLVSLSLKDADGRRPVMATYPQLQADPDAADLILFHEYYDGDTGRGLGASHQTGWSALVALLIDR